SLEEARPCLAFPAPSMAGLSHLENPESDPRLGGTRRSAAAATPWNRIANRPESKHELRLCPFGACSSGQLLPRKFLPYAIPLPFSGGGLGWGARGANSRPAQPAASPPPHPAPIEGAGGDRRRGNVPRVGVFVALPLLLLAAC